MVSNASESSIKDQELITAVSKLEVISDLARSGSVMH